MNSLKKIIFLLVISLFIISCKKVPENVLSEKKMIKVISEMALAEGCISTSDFRKQEYKKRELYYNSIFEKNEITSAQLDSSLMWYAKDPQELEMIYQKAGEKLKDKEASLTKKKSKAKTKK